MKREEYYWEMMEVAVKKYYQLELDANKAAEGRLPRVRIDLEFKIPKENLEQAKDSPFAFSEMNLVHIKAVNDRLTRKDILQYIGSLMVVAPIEEEKGIETTLTIISAEEVSEGIMKDSRHCRVKTNKIWLDRIEAEYPVYLLTLERLPKEKKYWEFLPFQPLRVLEQSRAEIVQMAEEALTNGDYRRLLLCLMKLQPEFYKRVLDMIKDKVEVALEFFPKAIEASEAKGEAKGIALAVVCFLEARFISVSAILKKRIIEIQDVSLLEKLIKEAATVKTLEEFEKVL